MLLTVVDRNKVLTDGLKDLLERRLRFALSRFDPRVRRATVVMEDVNGPRGGIDQLCRITVKLNGASDVVISDQDTKAAKAICRAAERAGRSVSRAIERTQQPTRLRRLAFEPT